MSPPVVLDTQLVIMVNADYQLIKMEGRLEFQQLLLMVVPRSAIRKKEFTDKEVVVKRPPWSRFLKIPH